jgi:hypothetical protein
MFALLLLLLCYILASSCQAVQKLVPVCAPGSPCSTKYNVKPRKHVGHSYAYEFDCRADLVSDSNAPAGPVNLTAQFVGSNHGNSAHRELCHLSSHRRVLALHRWAPNDNTAPRRSLARNQHWADWPILRRYPGGEVYTPPSYEFREYPTATWDPSQNSARNGCTVKPGEKTSGSVATAPITLGANSLDITDAVRSYLANKTAASALIWNVTLFMQYGGTANGLLATLTNPVLYAITLSLSQERSVGDPQLAWIILL